MSTTIYRYYCTVENKYIIDERNYNDTPTVCKNDGGTINNITVLSTNLGFPKTTTKQLTVGASTVSQLQNNYSTTNPTINSDVSAGYSINSYWVNTNTGSMYTCTNNTQGAAVWILIGATTTSLISEGTNLYYTQSRFNSAFAAETTDNLAQGTTNLYYSDTLVDNNTNVAQSTSHRENLNNPHETTSTQIGLGYVQNILNNFIAIINPTTSNDNTQNYSIGSIWANVVTGRVYVCVDATTSNAKWNLMTALSTNDLPQGSNNLYYTQTLFNSAFSGKTTDDLTEGTTNLYYTASRVNGVITSEMGVPNGLATLDSTGKVPSSQLNVQSIEYMGAWDASTNTPTITSGVGTNGNFYIVNIAGNTTIDGNTDWAVGDWILFNGTVWEQIQVGASVISVAGKQGNVILYPTDITNLSTTYVPEGTNLYYTAARFNTAFGSETTDNLTEGTTNLYYTDLRVENNTYVSQSTSHRLNYNNPHDTTATQIGLGNVLNTLMNYSAISNPSATNDSSQSYSIGSQWVNTSTDQLYICVDPTVSDAVWILATLVSTSNLPEGSNLYYTTTRFNNAFALQTTDNLTEGTNNLYYTIARFNSAFSSRTTTNLSEGTNLYYTVTRFNSAFAAQTTDNLAQGVINLYYSDTLVNNNTNVSLSTAHRENFSNPHETTAAQIGLGNVQNILTNYSATTNPSSTNDINSGYSIGSIWINTTTNCAYTCTNNTAGSAIWEISALVSTNYLPEGSNNLYYTNARVNTVIASITTNNIAEGSNNLYYTAARFNSAFALETTDNLAVGTTNLYYTTALFDASFSAESTTNLSEGTNLYYTDARVTANASVTANTNHRENFDNPHDTTSAQVGLSNVLNTLMNFTATTNPLATNDVNYGYSIGSSWINTTNLKEFICLNATSGHAVWKETSTAILYDAIVDVNGTGDYPSIKEALDAGNVTLYIKNGTYIEPYDLIIPNGGIMVGEVATQVVIYLYGAASIKIDGSNGVYYSNGTVNVTFGSNIVTGTGTTFTSASAGQYILISQNYYEITAINSDTSLVIEYIYNGSNLSNQTYIIQPMYLGVFLRDLIVMGSYSSGIYIRATQHLIISTITIIQCNTSIEMSYCSSSIIDSVASVNSTNIGFDILQSNAISWCNCETYNSASHGINFSGYCTNITIDGLLSSNNNGHGINFMNNCSDINIVNAISTDNYQNGINTDPSTSSVIIGNSTFSENNLNGVEFKGILNLISNCIITGNNASGVNAGSNGIINNSQIKYNVLDGITMLDDSNCVISGNRILLNNRYGVNMNNNESVISDNVIDRNLIGVYIYGGSNNIINGNKLTSNTNEGIRCESSATYNTIVNNMLLNNNIGVNVLVGADSNTVNGNTINNSTTYGVYIASNLSAVIGNNFILNNSDACYIASGATDNIFLSNQFNSNVGLEINDNGTISSLSPILINTIDTRGYNVLIIGPANATEVQIGNSDINVNVINTLTVGNTVNGRNIATDGTTLDDHVANMSNPHDVTAAQVGNTTAQWNANEIMSIDVDITGIADGTSIIYSQSTGKFEMQKAYNDELNTYFFDDFMGSSLNLNWVQIYGTSNSGSVDLVDGSGGQCLISSGYDFAQLIMGKATVALGDNPTAKFRIKLSDTIAVANVGFYANANNFVDFYYNDSTGTNWIARFMTNGTLTTIDSTIAASLTWTILQISSTGTAINFFINDTQVATFSIAQMPLLNLYILATADETATNIYCDYVYVTGNRTNN